MRSTAAVTLPLTLALTGAMSFTGAPAWASDYGGVVLGRRTGPDGALLIGPAASGVRPQGYVVVAPSIHARDGYRNGRGLPGYLGGYSGGYYGGLPGVTYEIPNQDRLYCAQSRAYYPAVTECATPWLRMRPGGGVTADSPIPTPGGSY